MLIRQHRSESIKDRAMLSFVAVFFMHKLKDKAIVVRRSCNDKCILRPACIKHTLVKRPKYNHSPVCVCAVRSRLAALLVAPPQPDWYEGALAPRTNRRPCPKLVAFLRDAESLLTESWIIRIGPCCEGCRSSTGGWRSTLSNAR